MAYPKYEKTNGETTARLVLAPEEQHRAEMGLQGEHVAVLIPCYNEESTIGQVVDDFSAALPLADIYVYDNNSSDDTAVIASEHGAIVRKYPLQGKGGTCRQMIRDIDAEYYLMVDGDCTYPADSARDLLAPLVYDEADTVIGDRLSTTYAQENTRAFHSFGNDLVRTLIKWMYGFEYADVMTGYRSFNRVFAENLPILSSGFEIETELSIHAVDKRWRICQIPIEYRDRPEGSESKLDTISDGMKVLKTIMGLFKSYRPLMLFGWLCVICCAVGIAIGVPIAMTFLETNLVPRIPSVILCVGFVFTGLLFLCAGLILDTSVQNNRRQYELDVIQSYRRGQEHKR